jgi:hypothetical protein
VSLPFSTPELRKQVVAVASSDVTAFTSDWFLIFGASTLRVVDELRAEAGALEQRVRHRFASVDARSPGAWTTQTTGRSANGIGTTDIDVSGTTDQLWCQLALAVRATSGVAEAQSALRGFADVPSRIIAQRTIEVSPEMNSGVYGYLPLCEPLGALDLDGMMFVVKYAGVAGTLLFRPAWRTFAADLDAPDAWTDLGSGDQSVTTDGSWNSGTLTTTPGAAKALFQPGLKLGGSGGFRGGLTVLVAAKWP